MAYAAATSPDVRPFRSRKSPPRRYHRTVLKGLGIGASVLAVTGVTVGSVIAAAGWMVAASVGAQANIVARPVGPQFTAVADGRDTAADTTGSVQSSASPINIPNLDLFADAGSSRTSIFNPMGALALLPERVVVANKPPSSPHRETTPAQVKTASLVDIPLELPRRPRTEIAVPMPRGRPSSAPVREASLGNAATSPDGTNKIPSRTAVYDIEARTVYMPNGERLEAHSGLGELMDDPRHVNQRMRGATPPNTYQLTLRTPLFHGVQAIRLNPIDEGKMFGRDGILAHTYMLGPNGQSNGCVSFKDYNRFLQAFRRGEVERIQVVSRMSGAPIPVAATAPPAPARHVERYALNSSRKTYSFREEYAAIH